MIIIRLEDSKVSPEFRQTICHDVVSCIVRNLIPDRAMWHGTLILSSNVYSSPVVWDRPYRMLTAGREVDDASETSDGNSLEHPSVDACFSSLSSELKQLPLPFYSHRPFKALNSEVISIPSSSPQG